MFKEKTTSLLFDPQTFSPVVHHAATVYRRRAACCFVASASEFLGIHLILHHARMDQSQSNCPTGLAPVFILTTNVWVLLDLVVLIFPARGNVFALNSFHWRRFGCWCHLKLSTRDPSHPVQEVKQTSSPFSLAKRQIPTFKWIDIVKNNY